jgi:hypothetical protein
MDLCCQHVRALHSTRLLCICTLIHIYMYMYMYIQWCAYVCIKFSVHNLQWNCSVVWNNESKEAL